MKPMKNQTTVTIPLDDATLAVLNRAAEYEGRTLPEHLQSVIREDVRAFTEFEQDDGVRITLKTTR